jgi:hypothetical protein
MSDIKECNGFHLGEKIMCKLNNRATLTVGKEYIIEYLSYSYGNLQICVRNDSGCPIYYTSRRFMDKSESRKHIINDILK